MSNHERFEELCVMAAAGELSELERQELMAHIENCSPCRKMFADMKDIHATWLPERKGFEIQRSAAAEGKLRQLIMRRVAAEGGELSSEAEFPAYPAVHDVRPSYRFYLQRLPAVAAAVVIVAVGVGFFGRMSARRSVTHALTGTQLAGDDIRRPSASDAQISQLEVLRENAHRTQLAQEKLEATLKDAQADRQRLQQQLGEAGSRATALRQSNAASTQEILNLQQQLDAARANESNAIAELATLKSAASNQQAELALVEGENSDLRDKLTQQTVGLDRERELMADGREIRDLIAARNLHIIDVYDTSGEGRTQKSFGRVFYTEDKSLVFYAYDLPVRRPAAKYAFYAWGKKDGSSEAKVRNLGIFYNDDQTQKRWVLKITDPQALSEIDSVFVTLEKIDGGVENAPTGKKLLSAYLGSPANHP
jgi:hypothetical protein